MFDARRWVVGAPNVTASGPKLPDGYELSEAAQTPDGRFAVVVHRFRSPRGIPTRNPDGSRSYRYAGPTKSSAEREYLIIWDIRAQAEKFRLAGSLDRIATSKRYVAVRKTAKVEWFDLEKGTQKELSVREGGGTPLSALAFGADTFFAVDFDGLLYSWSLPEATPKLTGTPTRTGRAEVLAVHPDGLLLVGFADGVMGLYGAGDGAKVAEWSRAKKKGEDQDDRLIAASFSPEGKQLATAHGLLGDIVTLWSLSRRSPKPR